MLIFIDVLDVEKEKYLEQLYNQIKFLGGKMIYLIFGYATSVIISIAIYLFFEEEVSFEFILIYGTSLAIYLKLIQEE